MLTNIKWVISYMYIFYSIHLLIQIKPISLYSEIFDMLKPSATVSQIVEESDGCVEHEDMNSVQEPQSENHDMDQLHMSNIVGLHNEPLDSLLVSIRTDTMFTSADIQDQLERDDTGQWISASGLPSIELTNSEFHWFKLQLLLVCPENVRQIQWLWWYHLE